MQTYLSKGDALTVHYGVGGADGKSAVRGASETHSAVLASAASAAKALGLTATDVVLSTAPLHTQLGLTAGALAAASVTAKVVLPSKVFDAGKALAAATQQRATVLVTTPAHAEALAAELARDAAKGADRRAYSLASLRSGVVITAPGGAAPKVTLGPAALRAVDASKGF